MRYYSNHPDHAARVHRAHLGGISEEAQAYIEKNPHLAHHPEMENIRNSPKSEHARKVAELHSRELSGAARPGAGEADREPTNEDTNAYLQLRDALIKSGERKVGRREETRLLMAKKNR